VYVEEICRAGATIEVSRYYTSRYNRPGVPRGPNRKKTKDEQQRINARRAEKKLRLLLNANFVYGDHHMILNYRRDARPPNREEMKKDADRFLRKLRAVYRKAGKELKYIHVMEVGARGGVHHHFVINHIDSRTIQQCWDKGGINLYPLEQSGQYRKLAGYLIKYSEQTLRREGALMGKRWHASRNLEQPTVEKHIIGRHSFKTNPSNRQGYYIDKDTVRGGTCDNTGYPYFTYTLIRFEKQTRIKLEERKSHARGKPIHRNG